MASAQETVGTIPPRLAITVAHARLALETGLLPIARRRADAALAQCAAPATKLLAARVRLHEARQSQAGAVLSAGGDAESVMDGELGRHLDDVRTLVEAGELEMAGAAVRSIVARWPAAVKAWLMLACLDVQTGQGPHATYALEQALRLQPHHAGARRLLHQLLDEPTTARQARRRRAA